MITDRPPFVDLSAFLTAQARWAANFSRAEGGDHYDAAIAARLWITVIVRRGRPWMMGATVG
jgi:hypothetical protein